MLSAIVRIASASTLPWRRRSGRMKTTSRSAATTAHTSAAATIAPKKPSSPCHLATRNAPSTTSDACAKFTTFVALKTITKPIAMSA